MFLRSLSSFFLGLRGFFFFSSISPECIAGIGRELLRILIESNSTDDSVVLIDEAGILNIMSDLTSINQNKGFNILLLHAKVVV